MYDSKLISNFFTDILVIQTVIFPPVLAIFGKMAVFGRRAIFEAS